MDWNWQQSEWPEFRYETDAVRLAEATFLDRAGWLLGAVAHLGEDDVTRIRIEILSDEALETSKIEGELLNRDSLQSSVRRQFGLATDGRKISPAEQGVSQLMVDAYLNFDSELTLERLCGWQALLMQGRSGLKDPGRLRRSDEPMQIVSGPLHDPNVHYEAPPSHRIPAEMESFLRWFNESRSTLPAIARAAIAHVYFESIHPFEDGNGRIGRAISELALSQSLGRPVLLALSQTISAKKKAYYAELGRASRTLNVAGWVSYFAGTVLDAQERSRRLVIFLVEKGQLLHRLGGRLNPRQEKVLIRMFAEGPDGFQGGLSAGNYTGIAKASMATVTRDLGELVEMGALVRTGERRYTRYWLNLPGLKGDGI